MSEIVEFFRVIRDTGGYTTPESHRPRRVMACGARAGLRFYVRVLGGVVWQGMRQQRAGTFGPQTLGQLSWGILDGVERMGTRVAFEGFDVLRGLGRQPAVIVANHMSLIETMMLPAAVFAHGTMIIVAKRGLTRYPWFGRILEASRPILVDRVNPRQDLADVLEQGAQRLKEGCSVLLFPQGTRLAVFDPRRFNSLGAKLARRAGVPLVPVACKTDFSRPGRLLRDFGPVDPSRMIRFAAGPLLDSVRPQRDLQTCCTRHIVDCLKRWNMPVVETPFADGESQTDE